LSLSIRENALAVINHDNPERVVYYQSFGYTPEQRQFYEQRIRLPETLREHEFRLRTVDIPYARHDTDRDFSRYYADMELPPGTRFDDFGISRTPGSMLHYERMHHPMRELTTVKELEEYPWPEEPPYDAAYLAAMKAAVDEIKARGGIAQVRIGVLFELAWQLRGMDNLFADFVYNEEFATALLERITEIRVRAARAAGMAGADLIFTADDLGIQSRMLMKPEVWRKWLKPRHARIIAAAREHQPDIHVKYHSDGYFEPLIPELLEIGITILNPVQPESTDPARLKRLYGDRLTFDGTIGVQTTMPFGTPEDVDRQVKYMIENVGQGGGLIVTARHTIDPGVPVENVQALLDAIDRYGHYR
jgi:uroporphyrinogen decarboxylase